MSSFSFDNYCNLFEYISNEIAYIDITEVFRESQHIIYYLKILLHFLEKKRKKEEYILTMFVDIINYYLHSKKDNCGSDLIQIIIDDNTELLNKFINESKVFDYEERIYLPDSIIYEPFLDNTERKLKPKEIAAFYGSLNTYNYLNRKDYTHDNLELYCSVIGDNVEIFKQIKSDVSDVKSLYDLATYSYSSEILSFIGCDNNVELFSCSLMNQYPLMMDNLIDDVNIDRTVLDHIAKSSVAKDSFRPALFSQNVLSDMIFSSECHRLKEFYVMFFSNWIIHIDEKDDKLVSIKLKPDVTRVTPEVFQEINFFMLNYERISFEGMFQNCSFLRSVVFPEHFDTSKVVSMRSMFSGCRGLCKIKFPLCYSLLSNNSVEFMFSNCQQLKTLDLSMFINTSKVCSMKNMFFGCANLSEIIFSESFSTRGVEDMSGLFSSCSSVEVINFPNCFDTYRVKNLDGMFDLCSSLRVIVFPPLFSTSNVTTMRNLFSGCSGLKSITFPDSFDTSKVVSFNKMFYRCANLEDISFGTGFSTDSLEDMKWMFTRCYKLREVCFPKSFNTKKVNEMTALFSYCESLRRIIFSSEFYTPGIKGMNWIFQSCISLEEIILPDNSDMKMFSNILSCLNRRTNVVIMGNNYYVPLSGDNREDSFKSTEYEVRHSQRIIL